MCGGLLSLKHQLDRRRWKQGVGLIQGQLLGRDGRMVTQMVHADFTFKFWSQTLGCVSLKDILGRQRLKYRNRHLLLFFSPTRTLFPLQKETLEWPSLLLLYVGCEEVIQTPVLVSALTPCTTGQGPPGYVTAGWRGSCFTSLSWEQRLWGHTSQENKDAQRSGCTLWFQQLPHKRGREWAPHPRELLLVWLSGTHTEARKDRGDSSCRFHTKVYDHERTRDKQPKITEGPGILYWEMEGRG